MIRFKMLAIVICISSILSNNGEAFDKSGIRPEVITLPEGPGSIEGLGSEFEVQLNTGTGRFHVPLDIPNSKVQPKINLQYNGGIGNGILGIGWSLDLPTIQRDLTNGVPKYDDSDLYRSSMDGLLAHIEDDLFRSRTEKTFTRYEKQPEGWIATTKDGMKYEFGMVESAKVNFEQGTFLWAINRLEDTYGSGVSIAGARPR